MEPIGQVDIQKMIDEQLRRDIVVIEAQYKAMVGVIRPSSGFTHDEIIKEVKRKLGA